jgi:hypothetical protein
MWIDTPVAGCHSHAVGLSRLIDRLAHDETRALRATRALARERVWDLAGTTAPGSDGELIPSTSTPPSLSPTPTNSTPPRPETPASTR